MGRAPAVRSACQLLCGNTPDSLHSVGLAVRLHKSGVHGTDAQRGSALADSLGMPHRPAGVTVVGVPFGTDSYTAEVLGKRAQIVVSLVDKCRSLPLSAQTKFLLLRSSLSVRMMHLQRTKEWRFIAAPTRGVETAVLSAIAELFRLPGGDGPGGYFPAPSPELAQLQLPIRHGGFGLRASTELDAHAAFLSGAAAAQLVLSEAPHQFRPFDNVGVARLRLAWQRVFDSHHEDCNWKPGARCEAVT